MINNHDKRIIVLDTPNILYYKQNKGQDQIIQNFMAIIGLLILPVILIVVITPKMIREYDQETIFLADLVRNNNGEIIFTENQDPDEVVLELALENRAPIITNDKFRQPKYDNYCKVKSLVIRFDIKSNTIIPRNAYWLDYLGGDQYN